MEDNLNGRWAQWKPSSMEDNPNWSKTLIEDDFNGRQTQGKTTLREEDLNGKWPQKASLNPMHSDFFCRNSNPFHTRHAKPIYREFICRNTRYYNSPLCYLTRLLNCNPVKEYNVKWAPENLAFSNGYVSSGQWK